jgi:aspartate racemase
MRLVGLIGGVSPESTEIYCRLLNRAARARLGGEHSANFVVWHLDYGRMIALYRAEDWRGYASEIVKAGLALKAAGVEALMIGSNTSHLTADALADATALKIIHVVDILADAVRRRDVRAPLLLGTPVTMNGRYYVPAFRQRFGANPVVPTPAEQAEVGRIIFEELCLGVVSAPSKRRLLEIIAAHPEADGVMLACTELSMILAGSDLETPVFDTTELHAAAATAFAFGREA